MDPIEQFYSNVYMERLHVDLDEREGEWRPFWAALGFDRFYDITMPEVAPVWEKLRTLDIFRYCRCHGIFRTDECRRDGWEKFPDQKKCLDTMLGAGIRPVMEISRIPSDFADPEHPLGFCGDFQGWADFVATFVAWAVETYGPDEVGKWPFEFWNEPDHHFWAGDQSVEWRGATNEQRMRDYFRMYDWTVQAVKRVAPEIAVGGPALTGNTVLLREFLKHVTRGDNYATGRTGSPCDFVSVHVYSNSPERFPWMINSIGRMHEIRETVDRDLGPGARIMLTEWGVTWGGGRTLPTFPLEHRNALFSAAYTLKFVKELIRLDFEMALYWGFSEWTWKRRPEDGGDFSGHRALYNYSGTARPVLGAYRLLDKLKGERCHVHRQTDTNNVDGLAAVGNGEANIVVWSHDPDPYGNRYPSRSEIIVAGLPKTLSRARLTISGYTHEHNTYSLWRKLGAPAVPDEKQTAEIDLGAIPKVFREEYVTPVNGMFTTGVFDIRPGECSLINLKW